MIVILDKMNIDLTVEEFIELYNRTEMFGEKPKQEAIVPAKALPVADPVVEKPKIDITENTSGLLMSADLAKYLGVPSSDLKKFRAKGMPCKKIESNLGGPHGYIFMYDRHECARWYKHYRNTKNPTPDIIVSKEVGTKEIAIVLGVGESTIFTFRAKGMPYKEIPSEYVAGKPTYKYNVEDCTNWYKEYKERKNKSSVENVPKPIDEMSYAVWKTEINSLCRLYGFDVGKMLGLTYKYMTKNYGIVWDQEAKDFFKANGHSPASTSQIAFWLESTKPAYKNITISCLTTILKEQKSV